RQANAALYLPRSPYIPRIMQPVGETVGEKPKSSGADARWSCLWRNRNSYDTANVITNDQ
ncbi:MAG TPA: hypothetical protein VN755_06685, partial [Steroidobacteraceae bacterium]|nr:hypothetical protein [Steroidobacteraceae bacterium]